MVSYSPEAPVDEFGDGCWMSQHTRFKCQTTKEPDVVFLGDSILMNMQYFQAYNTHVEPLHCVNFSIWGDQTQHILWRIQNGELDGFSPKVIVIMAGTHNVNHTAEDVCLGVCAIVDMAKEKQPSATIVVLGLLPCGRSPNPRRTKHEQVNRLLADRLRNMPHVIFLSSDWDQFVQSDGTISHRDMLDYMHPTENGYSKFMEPLVEELQNLLQTYIKTNAP